MFKQTPTETENIEKIEIWRSKLSPEKECSKEFLRRMDSLVQNVGFVCPDRILDHTITADKAEFVVDTRK